VSLAVLSSVVFGHQRTSRRQPAFWVTSGLGRRALWRTGGAAELDPTLRVVIDEEVFEADVPVPNVAQRLCA
jgi:hypothetical protein